MKEFKEMPVTSIVMGICLLVWVTINFNFLGLGTTNSAIVLGAYYKAFISAGEIWRLLTVGFVHVEIWHLAMNMYSFYNLGSSLETYYGSLKYGIILVLSTLSGSLFTYIIDSNVVCVGLSGGLYGLMGAEIMLIVRSGAINDARVRSSLISVVIMNICVNFIPSVGVYAHLGGLCMGVLLGMAFDERHNDKAMRKNCYITSICLTIILCGYSFTKKEIRSSEVYLGTDKPILEFYSKRGLNSYAKHMAKSLDALYDTEYLEYYFHD